MTQTSGRRDPATENIFAAIDLGTNNCRLMIARPEPEGGRIKVIDSFSRIVRLGEGLAGRETLSEDAMERTIEALHICAEKLNGYHITGSSFVATEACRRAKNGLAFIERIREETGLAFKILSGKDEAVLSFLGCSPLLDLGTRNAVVVDVGGGSTECTAVNMLDAMQPRIRTWFSIPHGMMTLSERFGVHDLTHAGYEDMVAFVTSILAGYEKEHGIGALVKEGGFQMLCSSGTVTTIGAIHLGLERYNRSIVDGTHIPLSSVHTLTRELIDMGYDGRRKHSCIGRDRADFILAGCAIVEAAGTIWPVDEITIADRGVREGIILSLFRKAS